MKKHLLSCAIFVFARKDLRRQTDSQHTGLLAESYFGEVAFRSAHP